MLVWGKLLKKSGVIAAVTNAALLVVIVLVAVVCFLPAPSSPAISEERVIRKGGMQDGVSLMINVYWGTDEVYEMLDILEEHEARATFFLGGCWADDNVECVREIAARGHEIGSHGYFHLSHDTLDLEENIREIATSVQILSLITHRPVTLFAPPSGAYCEETLEAAESMGMKTVLWSKDTIDWRDKDSDTCFERATKDAEGGDLILMHPMAHTVRALPRILEYFEKHRLRAVTVGENLG